MKRWWSDAEQSELILKSVDDSDVVNGVGVAILGYHGLATAVLKPLATETLVDTQSVTDALNLLDLEPVIKAVSEATKPIMKEASDRYAELLVNHHHSDSVRSIERLLMSWTQNGMAWPNAVERASDVYGVPVERLGKYAHVMKSAGLTPLVRSDYADRELMTYASWFGHRENTMTDELISKQEFVEEQHPRDELGQFTEKTEVTNLRDRRKARQARQVRQVKRSKNSRLRQVDDKQEKQEVKQKIADTKKLEQKVTEQKTEIKRQEIQRREIKRTDIKYRTIKSATENYSGANNFDDPVFGTGEEVYLSNDPFYFLIRKDQVEQIKRSPSQSFWAGRLRANFVPTTLFTKESFGQSLNNTGANDSGSQAQELRKYKEEYYIAKTTLTPLHSQYMNSKYAEEDATLAVNAHYKLLSEKPTTQQFQLMYGDIDWDVVQVTLENEDTFHDAIRIYKSDFVESKHPRDELGQFTEKNVSDLAAARERRNARQARQLKRVKNANALKVARSAQLAREGNLVDIKNSSLKQEIEQKQQEVKRTEIKRQEVKRREIQRREIKPFTMGSDNPGNGKYDFSNMYAIMIPFGTDLTDADFDSEIVASGPFLNNEYDTGVLSRLMEDFSAKNPSANIKPVLINGIPKAYESYAEARSALEDIYKTENFPETEDYIYSYGIREAHEVFPVRHPLYDSDGLFITIEPHDIEPYSIIFTHNLQTVQRIIDQEYDPNFDLEDYEIDDVKTIDDLIDLKSPEDKFTIYTDQGLDNKLSNPPINAYYVK